MEAEPESIPQGVKKNDDENNECWRNEKKRFKFPDESVEGPGSFAVGQCH